MRAAWMCATASMRKRWGSVIALTLLVGLIGAVALTGLAGARRTHSSFERFRQETRESDLTVFVPAADARSLAHLRARAGVAAIVRFRALVATINGQDAAFGGPVDPGISRTVERPRVLEGRRPRENRAGEISMPEVFAQAHGIRLGDTVVIRGFTPKQIDDLLHGGPVIDPASPAVHVRVVGITRAPSDLSILGTEGGLVIATRAFVREHGDEIGSFARYVLRVRLSDPTVASSFVKDARALLAPRGQSGEFQVEPTSETEGGVQQSIDVLATGLLVAAMTAALAGLVVLAIVLRRFVDGGSADLSALRGLGVSRRGRMLAIGMPVLPVALGGALLAIVGAWAASPLMPIGLARQAEPHLGLDVDPLVLGGGVVVVVVVVLLLGFAAARRAVGVGLAADTVPGTGLARAAASAGFAPPVTVGISMALESRRGRTAVPVRSAIGGAVVAVAGVVAVMVFAASLGELATTPSAYGYNWDAHIWAEHQLRLDNTHPCQSLRSAIARDPAVAAAAATCSDAGEVDGHAITFYAFRPLKGAIGPTVLDGRAPRARDEVALGHETLDQIHAAIGDRVRIAGPDGNARYRVVGTVALPLLRAPEGQLATAQAVADGAVLTAAGFESVSTGVNNPSPVVVRWKSGSDLRAAQQRLARLPKEGRAFPPLAALVPLEVDRLQKIDALPWALGGFLAVIGIVGIGFALVTGVRRRRRELAVLKTIGFRRAQLGVTVATQATVLGVLGLVAGVPLGIVVGRALWKAVARGAGLAPVATVSVLAILVLAVTSIAIVNLIAVVPARRAARLRPAVVLRSE
jgi:predicted lysophospholipase L1 biosynthesis ABC-type transport system permease subunit